MAEVVPSDARVDDTSGEPGELGPGSRLGRFELLVPIAKGGMARVWAARLHGQRGFTKLVAIKTILPNLAQEPEFEKMFLDEASIASRVHHPNVCEVLELGEERQSLYIVMEWINGESLSRLLRASGKVEPIDARIAARLVADAAGGLHAAHELVDDNGQFLNVVHRDVSPHNVLVSNDGNVKVADFGIAKALGQAHEATRAGTLKGKINYMAPEQVSGQPIDRRVDIFALGVCLFELTTGVKPFKGEADHLVIFNLRKGVYSKPSVLVPGYPPELEQIIERCLALSPAARFPTAERMRHALEEYIARSGPIVTQENISMLVRMRLGGVIDERRERIRLATLSAEQGTLAAEAAHSSRTPFTSSGVKTSGTGIRPDGATGSHTPSTSMPAATPPPQSVHSSMAPNFRPQQYAPQQGQHRQRMSPSAAPPQPQGDGVTTYLVAALVGLLVAGLIVAGGYAAFHFMHARDGAADPVLGPAVTSGAGSGPSAGNGPASTAAPALTIQKGVENKSASVRIDTLPEGALLLVDGKELGAGVREVPRPAGGAKVIVTVRASGFVDETVTVVDADEPVRKVSLQKKGTEGTGKPGSATGGKKKDDALPQNPY
jgi:eukaryotic-like serine/threonine-protein kinase